jgi:two-component system phosphate regulon sensor histidine kinase PhoR
MRGKRLLWQLFPSYLAITLLALAAVGFFAWRSLDQFYRDSVFLDLEKHARLIDKKIGPDLGDEQIARLAEEAKEFSRITSARVTVVRADGTVVCDTSRDPLRMENHAGRPELKTALAGSIGREIRYSTTVRRSMFYSAIPLIRDGKTIGAARVSIPATAVEEAQSAVARQLAVGGALIAALAALISLFVSQRISRPIETIRRGAERFARGDLEYQLPDSDSSEIGALARSLNSMAGQLKQRIRTIVQQSAEQNAVLGSMVEGVLAVNADRKIISINNAAAELLRTTTESALGRSVEDFIFDATLRTFISQAITCDEPIQCDVSLQAGSQRIIQVRGTALGRVAMRDHGAVIVLNDVTNIRRLENLRRDFVANVSHELKTPITSVKGFVETLLDGALDNRDDAERFLRIVAKQADRLGAIIEDLLSLAKIEESEEALDLELQYDAILPVLEAAAHDCQPLAKERGIRLELDCSEGLSADVNSPLLEQAVTNLLDNAVKYSGNSSTVRVVAQVVGSEIAISVIDQGVGISAEHLPRLFERFYRVDKARSRKEGGTGLGLAIVKHIASAHRGRVTVHSEVGVGTTFTIHLPRPQQDES